MNTEIANRIENQKDAVKKARWLCCYNCLHFTGDKLCAFVEQTPPIEVLIVGCELWDDMIPF